MSPRPLTAILFFALGVRIATAGSDVASPKFKDSRSELAAQITRTVVEGGKAMAEATEAAQQLDDGARAEFESLAAAVRTAELRLRRSLRWAQNASPSEWPAARTELAAYYESYAQAVAAVERFTIQAVWAP
jgi:hypothetical protein